LIGYYLSVIHVLQGIMIKGSGSFVAVAYLDFSQDFEHLQQELLRASHDCSII